MNDSLEVGASSHNNTFYIWNIIGDEVLGCQLCYFLDVGASLFFSNSRKSVSGLTTSTMLLWKLDSHFVKNISDITLEGGEKCTCTIDDDESEFFVIFKQVI